MMVKTLYKKINSTSRDGSGYEPEINTGDLAISDRNVRKVYEKLENTSG